MSDLIETLWQQYAIEAGEHCDAVERHLSASADDRAGDPKERVAALFRSFHSLKGAARAMDLFGSEAVAHRAETILGRVRAGTAELAPPVVEALLEALDALRSQTEIAVHQRRDGEAPPALLAKLDAFGAGSSPGAAQAAPPPAPPRPPTRLHDNEKLLSLFVEHLREGMASLTRALDLDSLDEDGFHAVDDTAERLEIGCERLSFLPFADTFRSFRAAVAARDADAVLAELQAVAVASARIGRLSNRDAGTTILVTLLADHNAQALARGVARALELMPAPDAIDDALPAQLDRVAATLDIMKLARSAALVRQIGEVVRGVLRADQPPQDDPAQDGWPALFAASRAAVTAIATAAAADPPEDAGPDVAEPLEALIRSHTDRVAAAREGARPIGPEELAELGLDVQLLRFLSPESTVLLRRTMSDPATGLYEVTAYLESSAALAAGFATWLGTSVTAITNWPEFLDGKTWLKVLVASSEGLDGLRNALAALDPSARFLQIRRCTAGLGPAEPPPAVPSTIATAPGLPVAESPPATAAVLAPTPAPPPAPRGTGGVLRVPGEMVDRFMARIDSMVLLSGDLNAVANDERLERALAALTDRLPAGDPDLRLVQELMERHRRSLTELDSQLSRSVDRLREAALDLRVVPIETLFNQFPRVVRELARIQNKKVRLAVDGGDVRIDKSMVETLYDPLMHMVRNGLDHGIEPPEDRVLAQKPEQATLSLRAVQRNNRVLVEIADDGRGIDVEAVRAKAVRLGLAGEDDSRRLPPRSVLEFIFAPGFSTVDTVTETSGRGVGMDVVRDTVVRLGGSIAIRTRPGEGTTFVIDLPLSAAIVRTLLVQVDDQVLAIPDRYVEEVCGFGSAEFRLVSGCWTVLRRDRVLPVVALSDSLGFAAGPPPPPDGQRLVVVLRNGERRIGVEIERLLRRGDLFVRDSHPGLANVPGVGGVSLLNDGRIVLILDGDALFRLACAAQQKAAERGMITV